MSSRSGRLYLHANRSYNLVVRSCEGAVHPASYAYGRNLSFNISWTKRPTLIKKTVARRRSALTSAQPQAAECKAQTTMFITDTALGT